MVKDIFNLYDMLLFLLKKKLNEINKDNKIDKIVFVDLDEFAPSPKGIGCISPLIFGISFKIPIVFEIKNANSSFKRK